MGRFKSRSHARYSARSADSATKVVQSEDGLEGADQAVQQVGGRRRLRHAA